MEVDVVWNESKNKSNKQKHNLSFEEASELFLSGSDYLEIFDAMHSDDEDRFLAVGEIHRGVIVVVWTERDEGVVRIISARNATNFERARFYRHISRGR